MLAIIPEFLFAAITEAYGVTGTANEFQSELEKTLAILLMKTMTFLLVKCINQITRKKNYLTIENKLFTVLLTLPIATIIIFMCIYYSHISFTGVNRIMIPIGAALLLMTNICIFAVFDKLIERSEEVKKMELLYQKSKAENINQKYINKVNEDKRAFLHDVNKFLCITANLIENGKNLELDNMVRHLGIRIQEMKNYSCCADPVLNSILCERKFVAESKGILYKIKLGNNLRTDFIEDLDLISIVGNLLDNAIEAAEKTEKDKYVICNMYMGNENHFLVMEFRNNYIVPLIKEKERYISTKRDSGSHGIGLHTVKKLVERYGKEVAQGEIGELIVKGPYTIQEYYRLLDNDKYFNEEGFYLSGDKVRKLEDGNLKVVGRVKEQINRAGEKIMPSELEELIIKHPDIMDCAVIGIEDEMLGNKICVYAVARKNISLLDIRKHLEEAGIAMFKLPDVLRLVKRIPVKSVYLVNYTNREIN